MVPPLHEGTDGGRSSVENADPVLFNNLPKASIVRPVGGALIDDNSGCVLHRPIDEVTVPRNPAHVRRAPVDILRFKVEDVLCGQVGVDHVAGLCMHDALRLPGGPARVKQEKHVLGIQLLSRTVVSLLRLQLMVPVVTTLLH